MYCISPDKSIFKTNIIKTNFICIEPSNIQVPIPDAGTTLYLNNDSQLLLISTNGIKNNITTTNIIKSLIIATKEEQVFNGIKILSFIKSLDLLNEFNNSVFIPIKTGYYQIMFNCTTETSDNNIDVYIKNNNIIDVNRRWCVKNLINDNDNDNNNNKNNKNNLYIINPIINTSLKIFSGHELCIEIYSQKKCKILSGSLTISLLYCDE